MALYGIIGERKASNRELITCALHSTPCLLIDSANSANTHAFTETADLQQFSKVFVVEAESLYRFAPTIERLTLICERLQTKKVFITTFTHLFGYDDNEEDLNVFTHCWDLLASLARSRDIYVAVESGSVHEGIARKHGIQDIETHRGVMGMGHTLASQRIMSDVISGELARFGKALRDEDREVWNRLLKEPLKHLGTISYTSSANVWAVLLLATLVEQQKVIDGMKKRIELMEVDGQFGGKDERLVDGCV